MRSGRLLKGYMSQKPERLIVSGFRCWMAGYQYDDVECWEYAWNLYAKELGAKNARAAISELQFWVRDLRAAAVHPIKCLPNGCACLCRDESLALSMVAASQCGDEDAALAAALDLAHTCERTRVQPVLDAASRLSGVLADAGEIFAAGIPHNVMSALAVQQAPEMPALEYRM